MKGSLVLVLIALTLLLVACSKTEVVKLGEEAPVETVDDTPIEPADISEITGRAVECTDSDGEDIYTSGRVTVKYDDGTKSDFIDECPVKNENFLTEYLCDGNNVKPKNTICDKLCIAGVCLQ